MLSWVEHETKNLQLGAWFYEHLNPNPNPDTVPVTHSFSFARGFRNSSEDKHENKHTILLHSNTETDEAQLENEILSKRKPLVEPHWASPNTDIITESVVRTTIRYLILISPSFDASGRLCSCLWHFLGIFIYICKCPGSTDLLLVSPSFGAPGRLYFVIVAFPGIHLYFCYNITKTYLYNFDPLKPHFYTVKLVFTGVYSIFLYFCSKT